MIDTIPIWKQFSANDAGRDFVVGDIHGCYTLLDQKLKDLNFDQQQDRLFSVGDLCDRGPESIRALEYLNQDWFHPVCGNHDTFIMYVYEGDTSCKPFWYKVGGTWWETAEREQKRELYKHICNLPYFIEVQLPNGQTVGIVHAEIPINHSWYQTINLVEQGDEQTHETIIWSRDRIGTGNKSIIDDIDRVYCGHTILDRVKNATAVPHILGNTYYIDTGGYMSFAKGGAPGTPPYDLTVLQIN